MIKDIVKVDNVRNHISLNDHVKNGYGKNTKNLERSLLREDYNYIN